MVDTTREGFMPMYLHPFMFKTLIFYSYGKLKKCIAATQVIPLDTVCRVYQYVDLNTSHVKSNIWLYE